jgi:Beta-lactamase enzyme family
VRRGAELALVAALAAVLGAPPAPALPQPGWSARVTAAERYAEARAGLVSFAVVGDDGRLRGYRPNAAVPMASLLKPMLLVSYLRLGSVRHRSLTEGERSILGPMIRSSSNVAAQVILGRLGSAPLERLARTAGMKRFRLVLPIWGLSQTTARDQARFFYRIDSYVPARHRRYALKLLATIVPSQRWGIGRVAHPGWRLYFKGGWGSGTGLVDHQSALLVSARGRVGLSITTRFNPDHAYGKRTLKEVARRLVGQLAPPPSSGALPG